MSRHEIKNPLRRERLLVKNGNTSDIIKSVMEVANDDQLTAQVDEFAQRFKGTTAKDQYEKLRELWKYTRREIQYEEDPEGKQFIKEPARVYWDNQLGDGTDCKSLSLFEYFCCRAIGVQCYFEFVSYFEWWEDKGKRITHVYPVAIVPGIGDVVIDAVYTKFDQRAPGATRAVKKYTKVFNRMADIYRVSGLKGVAPTQKDLISELNDRAKLVKPTSFVDYPKMSQGEMETFLLAQRDKMLSEFYQGTPQGAAYSIDFQRRRDALYNGLHRGFNIFGAKARTKPASGYRTEPIYLKAGFNALFDDAPNGAERASVGVIPQVDCDALYEILPFQQWKAQGNPNDFDLYNEYQAYREAQKLKCITENLWRDALNKEWESNGPVLIYEFLTSTMVPNNLSGDAALLLGGKSQRHKDYVSAIWYGSKISRTNLRLWLENGCIQKSIQGTPEKGGIGPQLPTDYINALRAQGQEGIGAFPLIVIPIAIAIMALNYKAAKNLLNIINGKQTLKDAIKNQVGNIQDFIQKYASEIANLAGKSDWELPSANGDNPPPFNCDPGFHFDYATGTCVPNNNSNSNNNTLLIGAAVVGAALLLKNKK